MWPLALADDHKLNQLPRTLMVGVGDSKDRQVYMKAREDGDPCGNKTTAVKGTTSPSKGMYQELGDAPVVACRNSPTEVSTAQGEILC